MTRMGIPSMGIEYVSGNDGPVDGFIIPDSSQVLIRREFIYIERVGSVDPAAVAGYQASDPDTLLRKP